jgi:hypothetical protein
MRKPPQNMPQSHEAYYGQRREKFAVFLELEFHGELYQSGRGGADHASEVRIVDLPIDRGGTIKLRMIKRVESLDPDIKRLGLSKMDSLAYLDVKVLDARPVKRSSCRIS